MGCFQTPISLMNAGLGMSHINFNRNILESIMDPASLAMVSKICFADQTGQKFNLKPLSHHNFAGEIPNRFGNFALGIQTFGIKQYKESTVSFAYGRRIKQRLRGGVNVNIYFLSITNYGSATTMGISLAWQINLNNNIRWGL